MISLHLQNFQSHKDTRLEFQAGVNAITGISDSGKSAIMRAIKWVWTNRPLGDFMVRWGTKECSVTIGIGGHIITRTKTKGKNAYILNGQELKAVGTDVPQEVSTALGLKDINRQNQRDLDFLLSLSPGDASKYIQSLCGLEAVPPVMQIYNGMELKTDREIQNITNQLSMAKALNEKLVGAERCQDILNKIQKDGGEAQRLNEKVGYIGSRISKIEYLNARLNRSTLPTICTQLDAIKAQMQHLADLKDRKIPAIRRLCDLLRQGATKRAAGAQSEQIGRIIANIQTDVEKQQGYLQKLARCTRPMSIVRQVEKTIPLKPLLQKASDLTASITQKQESIASCSNKQQNLEKLTISITAKRASLRQISKDLGMILANLPKVCPTCNQPIKEDSLCKN